MKYELQRSSCFGTARVLFLSFELNQSSIVHGVFFVSSTSILVIHVVSVVFYPDPCIVRKTSGKVKG